jgi:hypothetical protein
MPEKMKALWKGQYEDLPEGGRRPLEYLDGVPARSLTEEEFDALSDDVRENVRKCGLYDVRTEKEMAGGRAAPEPDKKES